MKKTEFISIKIDPETKRKLLEKSKRKEWTLSHYCRKLLEMDAESSEKVQTTDSRSQDKAQ